MASTILTITSNPQDFADGAWPRAHFNGDAGTGKFHWRFSHTAATQGAWGSYFGRPTGGIWRTSGGTIDVYDIADNLLISRAVTIPAGSFVDFTVDANTGSLKLENFSAGNGTFSFTPADIFTAGGLRVGGVFGQSGWTIAGTFSNVDDADPATSGVGSSTGAATVAGAGASIAAGAGSSSGVATVAATSNAPGGAGASAGIASVAGVGASIAAATGSSSGSSTVGAASPSPLSMGIGAVIQRINSTQPPTGTLSTWATDLVVSSINTGTDTLTSAGHGFIANTFPGPFYLSTTGTFPGGTDGATRYWCVVVDADNIRLATSGQNAKAGTVVNLTSAGSGTISLTRVRDSEASGSAFVTLVMRGVWSTDGTAATDNKGNNYSDRNDEFAYAGFPGSRVRARVDVSATGGAAHTVSATWGNIGGTGDEVTTAIVEVKGATLCKAFAHNETAVGSAVITTPAITTTDEALVLVGLCGNGPVNQDHTWISEDGTWTKHVDASAEQDTSGNGYIQLTWFWKKFATAQTNLTAQFRGINNEGAQVFKWAFQTRDPAPGAGASSGTSTVAGVGASIAAGSGSSSGSSTASAAGSQLGSVGASVGTSTASAAGAAIFAAQGAASGTAAVAAAGESTAAASGAAVGTASATGTGSSIAAAQGSSAGSAVAFAASDGAFGGAGNSAGSALATAQGAVVLSGVGASAGSSSASGAGSSVAQAFGSSAGTSSATSAASSIASSAGASTGSSSSTAIGSGGAEPDAIHLPSVMDVRLHGAMPVALSGVGITPIMIEVV